MALRGYELLLFVRAQNQASATLRRVANDVNNLKRVTKSGVPVLAGAERMQAQGRLIAHAGRTAQLAGLAAGAGLAIAAKGAADFNTQITLAASQARDLDAPLAQVVGRTHEIEEQVKGLMRTFPAASEEMAASAYEIYSGINLFEGGLVDTGRALDSMTLANKAAVAGQADLADSTSLLITLANNFGDSSMEMGRNMDTAFDIIRFGRLHISDLDDMMNKIAPAAKAAGQSLEQLSGPLAYLTTVIPSQRQVATGTARLLDVLRHPDIKRGLQEFGVNVEDSTGHMRPFMDIMGEIIKTFPELKTGERDATSFFRTISQRGRLARTGAPGLGIVSTIEGRRIFTQLVTGWDQVMERQSQVTKNTNELQNAYEALSESSGVKFQRFVNNLKRQLLDIGASAIPVFEEIGGHLSRLSRWWDSLDEVQKRNIVRWATYGAVLLVAAGAISAVVGALTAMAGTFAIFIGSRGAINPRNVGMIAKFAGGLAMVFGPRAINPTNIRLLMRAATLLKAMSRIAALGAITLIIKAGMTGDPTAMQLLQGMLTGAVAGSAFGPYGALAGAITVPILMKVAPLMNKPEQSMFAKLVANDFKKNFKSQKWIDADDIRDNWTRTLSQLHLYNIFVNSTQSEFLEIIDKARANGRLTGLEYVAALKIAIAAGLPQAVADVKFAEQVHDPASSVGEIARGPQRAAKKADDGLRTSNLKAWDKYFENLAKYRNADKDRAVKNADVVGDATRGAIDELSSFLIGKYKEMEDANRQFMGSLFQGEWLTGEAARLSEEWGIKPMAKDLLKDMQMQLRTFNQFNASLSAIAKRGAPRELMEELKALGPAGIDSIEALRKASPEQFNAIVRAYKQRQAAIKKQTQIDFNAQLKLWKQHGGNMMGAIIQGLTAEHAQLENYFRNMVGVWFPGFIASEVRSAQVEAARNAPEDARGPKPKAPSGADPRHRNPATGRRLPQIIKREGDVSVTIYQQPGETSADAHRRAAVALKAKVRNAKRNSVAEDWGIGRKHKQPVKNPPKGTR